MLRPVTAPVELTATIELSDDVQTTARSARTLPAESLRVAASLVALPTFTFACDGLIAIDATGTGTTVTIELLRFPPTSKVIVVVPRAEACTRPVEDTGAIDVEFEVQCVAVGLRSETVSPDLSSTEYANCIDLPRTILTTSGVTATDPTGVWTVTFAVSVDFLPAARIIVDPMRRAETRPVGETTATFGSSELQVTGPEPGPVDASSCCSSHPRSSVSSGCDDNAGGQCWIGGPVASCTQS
jgi:hypothetical protein